MPGEKSAKLIQDYEFNARIIRRLADALTHEDSLVQPPFEANCFNWVLGHMINGRNSALIALGLDPLWSEEVSARYRSGSEPIRGPEGTRHLDDLRGDLDKAQSAFTQRLSQITEEQLEETIQTGSEEMSRWDYLAGLNWHETYHLGQLEMLRAMVEGQRR